MKRIFLSLLALGICGSVSVKAQITIGSNETPHPGAVLDLRSSNAAAAGLILPNVSITSVNDLVLPGVKEKVPVGTAVYNTNADMKGGQGAGLYIWMGEKWSPLGTGDKPEDAILIQRITVKFADPNQEYMPFIEGGTRQFTTSVTPGTAFNQEVEWSVAPISAGASASITPTGMLTTYSKGTVQVRATATDGSGIVGAMAVTVLGADGTGPVKIRGVAKNYNGYCYMITNKLQCWMVENSMEGTSSYTTFPGKKPGERGYYYSLESGTDVCPDGYRLPVEASGSAGTHELKDLIKYLLDPATSPDGKDYWLDLNNTGAGFYDEGAFIQWGCSNWWAAKNSSSSKIRYSLYLRSDLYYDIGVYTDGHNSVRCIKK